MIVDSSALVAILTSEPERELFLKVMSQAPARRLSAASLLETNIVLNRLLGPKGAGLLEDFLNAAEVEVVPFSPAHDKQEPLLFKGRDFAKTDLSLANLSG